MHNKNKSVLFSHFLLLFHIFFCHFGSPAAFKPSDASSDPRSKSLFISLFGFPLFTFNTFVVYWYFDFHKLVILISLFKFSSLLRTFTVHNNEARLTRCSYCIMFHSPATFYFSQFLTLRQAATRRCAIEQKRGIVGGPCWVSSVHRGRKLLNKGIQPSSFYDSPFLSLQGVSTSFKLCLNGAIQWLLPSCTAVRVGKPNKVCVGMEMWQLNYF